MYPQKKRTPQQKTTKERARAQQEERGQIRKTGDANAKATTVRCSATGSATEGHLVLIRAHVAAGRPHQGASGEEQRPRPVDKRPRQDEQYYSAPSCTPPSKRPNKVAVRRRWRVLPTGTDVHTRAKGPGWMHAGPPGTGQSTKACARALR